ncbi:MAG: type I polyketide synthase, partial [Acidobacteriota bacterium]
GVLDNLRLGAAVRRPPGPGEVEIQVTHAGLNFRDVLNALGMYPGEAGPLGAECVGTVARVGVGVSHLAPGDDVMGMAGGSLRSYVTTAAGRIVRKPPTIGSEAAATIPLTFLTAEYALTRLAALQRGERVLIHAATGGVGLAAVQLARRAGAEIFATAGSPEKRALLRGMGIEHVFDSRTLGFSAEILACTNGEGVHVALNALAGEFIGKTVDALAPGGRFVEIGKTGIWTDAQMRARRPDVRYFPFDLADVDPAVIGEMLDTLLLGFKAGEFTPLPRRVYSIAEAASAFRFMAQAKHVGKVVLSIRPHEERRIRSDATYMVTGGFSGLGLTVAGWLKDQGARRLALVGRTGPDRPGAAAAIAQLEAAGVEVLAFKADVGQPDDMTRVFDALRNGAQLRGIIHAAGVLDDGTIEQLTWDRFERVFGPKVYGAWHLHRLSRTQPLDFFVLFSSSSALIGTPGQGNYASANAFLDALAHHRHASRLPAVSINWGPWGEVGMAAGLARQDQQRWDRLGLSAIDPRRGLAILEQALAGGAPQLAVLPVDWERFAASTPGESASPLFGELVADHAAATTTGTPLRPALIARLEAVPEKGRAAAIQAHVRDAVRHVLGVDPSFTLELSQGLRALGMDSLMAVELRNYLQASTGRPLPSTLAFDRPTIAALAAYLEPLITVTAAAAASTPVGVPVPAHADLDALSDEDAELLLAQELER